MGQRVDSAYDRAARHHFGVGDEEEPTLNRPDSVNSGAFAKAADEARVAT